MTIQELIEKFQEVLYIEDTSIIPVVAATVLSNRIPGDPIWLMIVGPSSGGKSEIINAAIDVEFVHFVSTLTSNTFLSGMSSKEGGAPTSLLHRIGNGVIAMKDFTSIISMHYEAQKEVLAQMREIYDGHITKETGTGKNLTWTGKINLIAGVTDKIYSVEDKFSEMGARWINFVFKDQDRKKTTHRAMSNHRSIKDLRKYLADAFSQYIQEAIATLPEQLPKIPNKLRDEIIELSDFVATARSPVERDYKGDMTLVHSPEMPARMASQFANLAMIFTVMDGGKLTKESRNIMYRIILDSIPKTRRMALRVLAQYDKVKTSGMASELGYPTPTARKWLEDLGVHKLIERDKQAGFAGFFWKIKPEYRDIMVKYEGVKYKGGDLEGDDTEAGTYEDVDPGWRYDEDELVEEIGPQEAAEREREMDKLFDAI